MVFPAIFVQNLLCDINKYGDLKFRMQMHPRDIADPKVCFSESQNTCLND